MLWLLLLAACPSDDPPPSEDPGPDWVQTESTVILVSLDGFRHDYQARAETPVLDRLSAEGVTAEALVPVFPTNTFPNHYTLATGLYPARHGILDNAFYAPDLDETFQMTHPAHNADPRWWGGEPIWITAEREGLLAGTHFWVGSEVEWEHGIRQTWAVPYDGSISFSERVDTVLGWLDAEAPPRFVTLYFNQPDSAGHAHGPDDDDVLGAVRQADAALGRLVDGLEARGILDATDLLVVSDHGMTTLHPSRKIYLDDHLDTRRAWVHRWGPWSSIWPRDAGDVASIVEGLSEVPNASCAARPDLPDHLQFGEGARTPPIACLADAGWYLTTRSWTGDYPRGGHGFDSAQPDMHGLFVARGPHVREGATVDAFEAVHVHALLTWMLDLDPPEVDARLEEVEGVLRPL